MEANAEEPFMSSLEADQHRQRVRELFDFMMDNADLGEYSREEAIANMRIIANEPQVAEQRYDEFTRPELPQASSQ